MKERPIQFFSEDYLTTTSKMTATQIVRYLEEFRLLVSAQDFDSPLKLISIKIPELLLAQFRNRCEREGVAYQRKIKALMRDWLTIPLPHSRRD